MSHSTAEAGELSPRDPVEGRGHRQVAPVEGKTANTPRLGPVSTSRQRIAELARQALGMAVAIAWLPGPAGTRRRVAKPSVEEPDAAEPARPDLWGARVSNDPGLPDPRAWRCCRIDRSGGAFRSGEPSPTDAVGRGPTEFGHPIQHVAREERLGLSPGFRAGSQTRSDDRLVPKDHVLHACLPRVSGGFLPPPTAEYLHASDRPIASTGPRAVPRQRRGSRRRHHDPRVSGAGRRIERDGVVRRVGGRL